ncbi:Type IV leader peptidase family protein [Methyloligella halotolerans]|uniref:Type IV leader peptidase family protein n=1 Tax=Methyloligella halotolerans TaxID=1177755 RepID=A0A1E2RVV7_9HYPH|nr:Type IV leader peptidase family protein [Methyloligella halotolerans]
MILNFLILTIFPACMALAASMDLITMTVPNRIPVALVIGFICLAPLVGLTLPEIGLQVAFAIAALVIGFGMFAMGWIGGGDAKLFAATVLWLNPAALVTYTMLSAILGGALTLMLLMYRSYPLPAFLMSQDWVARLHEPREGVPYGIALAAGGLIAYAQTPFMMALAG